MTSLFDSSLPKGAAPLRLLVVDDREGFRQQLRRIFEHEGYEVSTAESGEEAIATLEQSSPDLVITDIVMPHGDGFVFLEHIKKHAPRCPVIIMTAYSSQESAVKALRLGAYDYVTKPFDLDVILAVVKRAADYCRLQRAMVESRAKLIAQVSEMSALYDTSLDLVSSFSLPQVLESLVSRAMDLLHAQGGNIYLYDETRAQLTVAVSRGPWGDSTGHTVALGEGLAGKVAQSGRPLQVNDYSNWKARELQYKDAGFTNVVGVPLMLRDRVVGVLNVADDARRGGFSEADEALLVRLAPLAALAIERARLHSQTEARLAEVRRAHQEISALQDLTAVIQSSLALPDVLSRIAEGVVQGLGYRAAMVAVYDPRRDALVVKAAAVDQEVWAQGEALAGMGMIDASLTMDYEENLAIRYARRGEMAVTHQLADLFRPAVGEDIAQAIQQMAGVRTLATVPLMADDQLVGNFFAGSHRDNLGEADIASLRAFARQAALAIEHARLFEQESERRRLADILRGISAIISSTLDLEELQTLILQQVAGVFIYDSCGLFLVPDGRPELVAGQRFGGPADEPVVELNETPADLFVALSKSRRALVLSKVPEEMQWPATGPARVQSWMGAPLIARNEVLGFLTMNSYTANTYHREDEPHMMAFAHQTAAAIANARLYAETERNWREQEYLQEIAQVFNSTLDLEQVLALVMAKTNDLLGVEAGSVALLTKDRRELVFHASVGGGADAVKGFRMPAGEGIVGWVVSHAKSLLVSNVSKDPRHYGRVDAESGFETRSILCVPLIAKGVVIGAIEVLNKIGGFFTAADRRMAEAMALSAATAIENAQLFQREKQALERLRQAQTKLIRTQRLAALGQIGVTVRHEVNNPLTVILGNADWLLQELDNLQGEPLSALEAIRANAIRIKDIINKLKDIKTDRVTEYTSGIEMIDLHGRDAVEGQEGDMD